MPNIGEPTKNAIVTTVPSIIAVMTKRRFIKHGDMSLCINIKRAKAM